MEPIATIKSPFKQKLGIPRQGSLAAKAFGKVIFDKSRVGDGALDGLEGFSHLWLIYSFHKHESSKKAKISPPRLGGQTIGVFASRSPHRPNAIGLTLARIQKVDPFNKTIEVSEIDLLDGTPIYDVKPYLGYADRPQEWNEAWTDKKEPTSLPVHFNSEAAASIAVLKIEQKTLDLVENSLGYDPRPISQIGKKEQFTTLIENWNFTFRVTNDFVEVLRIELVQPAPQ